MMLAHRHMGREGLIMELFMRPTHGHTTREGLIVKRSTDTYT